VPDFAQPVSLGLIAATIGVIFALIALGIVAVRRAKNK
jgi:hypothetical protein